MIDVEELSDFEGEFSDDAVDGSDSRLDRTDEDELDRTGNDFEFEAEVPEEGEIDTLKDTPNPMLNRKNKSQMVVKNQMLRASVKQKRRRSIAHKKTVNEQTHHKPLAFKLNNKENLCKHQASRSHTLINDAIALPLTKEDMIRLNCQKENKNKLNVMTAVVLRLRQDAINEMITGINDEYIYKFRNARTLTKIEILQDKRKRCLFTSGDGFRVKWDLLVIFLAVYSCFVVPIQVAFEPSFDQSLFFIIPDLFVNMVFFIDILISFRTTYIHSKTGEEITDLRIIGKNYLKCRFWLDFLAIIPFDYIGKMLVSKSSSGLLQLFSLLKLVRVLRLGKLISIMKVKDDIKLSLRLLKLIFFLCIYLHCLGCVWYYIVIKKKQWLPPLDYVYVNTTFYNQEWDFKYFMSLFHAVMMFSGNDIGPRTTFEIIFVSFFVVMGAILNANLFGQLTVILSTMNRKASLFQEKFDITTTAMKNLNLPENLQTKVTGFLTFTESFQESQKELKSFLDIISPSLRQEVVQYIFSETLKFNPIFKGQPLLIDYMTKKLVIEIHMPEDQVITQGETGTNIYFIAKGECEVFVTDHNSLTDIARKVKPGDLFGEVAILCGSRRTASVKTTNYSTLAFVCKPTFKDMCQQFPDIVEKMKQNLKKYQDRLKLFCKYSIKEIPFFKRLSEESIEEVTYHLQQKYYDANDIIFREGNAVDNLLIITRGEVDLILKVEDHELVLHNLYQGCYMGGYKVLKDSIYSHTARAVTSVTLHSLSKDSISLLQKNLPDFNHAIEKARIFIDNTSDPFIGFGMFRSKETSLTPIKLFKMAVIKVLKINRDLKEAGIKEGVPDILKRTVIGYYNEEEEGRKPHNYQKTSLKILQKLTKKIDFLERHIKTLEKEVKNGAKYQNRSHRLFKQLRMEKNNTNTCTSTE
ncbi:unnamed protein product [Moneuplotes crassus]|uniref:Cyclic nucleotide-binding domain-containing protein n=1 Tax=Euplotes crassus TaxID=5936 RepID=A0AAD1XHT3_EUPCR|nr:unnamed protein product [Moneuplotes crassus]